jgi:FMN phosphatase YigB (HAD superfamily)
MLNYMDDTYSDEKFNRWYMLDKRYWIDRQNGKINVPDEYNEPIERKVKWVRSQRYVLYFDNKITIQKAMEINDIYINALNDVVVPVNGVKEVLEYLASKYIVAIATNGPSVATGSKIRKIGCQDYVDHVFAADMFGHMKPSTLFFRWY